MRFARTGFAALVAAVLAASSLVGCVPSAGEQTVAAAPSRPPEVARRDARPATTSDAPARDARPATTSGASARSAARLLSSLPIKPRASHAGYDRGQFGAPWQDVDRNGCDTRDDILRRDLVDLRVEPGKRGCVIEAGVLADPYTGEKIQFQRGRGSTVDIDHVVALGDAWSTGAADLDQATRVALANDPLNLLAVDASTNRAKGDDDAARWLPPNHGFRCAYVARQIAVKAKYGLWITADEHDAMAQVLAGCPDQLAPEEAAPPRAPVEPPAPRRSEPTRAPVPTTPKRAADPDYGSCKNARAHGAGPYHRDRDPEYHYYRDGDGDGVVCE